MLSSSVSFLWRTAASAAGMLQGLCCVSLTHRPGSGFRAWGGPGMGSGRKPGTESGPSWAAGSELLLWGAERTIAGMDLMGPSMQTTQTSATTECPVQASAICQSAGWVLEPSSPSSQPYLCQDKPLHQEAPLGRPATVLSLLPSCRTTHGGAVSSVRCCSVCTGCGGATDDGGATVLCSALLCTEKHHPCGPHCWPGCLCLQG